MAMIKPPIESTIKNKAKNILMLIGGLVIGLVIFSAITGIYTASQAPVITPLPVVTPTQEIDTSGMKKVFTDSCTDEGASYLYCSCVFDDIIDKHGVKNFINMALEFNETDSLDDEMIGSIAECIHLL